MDNESPLSSSDPATTTKRKKKRREMFKLQMKNFVYILKHRTINCLWIGKK